MASNAVISSMLPSGGAPGAKMTEALGETRPSNHGDAALGVSRIAFLYVFQSHLTIFSFKIVSIPNRQLLSSHPFDRQSKRNS